jgi:hypothetical protein
MKIYTRIVLDWDGNILESDSYEYDGELALACGAPGPQKQLANLQSQYYQTLINEAQQVFGQTSYFAQQLSNEFETIFAAGPSQQGWSPEMASAINANIVTTGAEATRSATEAALARTSATGGGNEFVPSGAVGEEMAEIATTGAVNVASQQNQALVQNYMQGLQNWQFAAKGLAGIPGMLATGLSPAGAATQAGEAAGQTWNQIAQESFAPWGAVIGAAGEALGGLTGGNLLTSANSAGSQSLNYSSDLWNAPVTPSTGITPGALSQEPTLQIPWSQAATPLGFD